MKKLLFAAFAVLGLASCKKDYTCQCKIGDITHDSKIENVTLKEATDKCNDSGSIFGVDYDCKVNVFK